MSTKPKFTVNLDAASINIKQLVDYQEGAIVSREVYVKKTGVVTVFAFDKDQGLSEHTAPFDAMVHVLEGSVEIKIGGKPFILNKDDFIIMPGNVTHALKAKERFKMILYMFILPKSDG
jgi:quercetin dioxygenase-like cupin family protein